MACHAMTNASPRKGKATWDLKIDEVAGDCRRKKNQKGTPPAPMIRQPATRILVDGVKKIFRCAEEADRGDARSQRFQILREKLLPELLTKPHQKHRARSRRDVAFDSQGLCYPFFDAISHFARSELRLLSEKPRWLSALHHLFAVFVERIVNNPLGRVDFMVALKIQAAKSFRNGVQPRALRLLPQSVVSIRAIDDLPKQHERRILRQMYFFKIASKEHSLPWWPNSTAGTSNGVAPSLCASLITCSAGTK